MNLLNFFCLWLDCVKKTLSIAVLLWAGGALAQSQLVPALVMETNQVGLNASIEVLGDGIETLSELGPNESRLMIYRHPSHAQEQGVVSVFLNGQYHTSLVKGGFSEVCMPPSVMEIKLRATKAAVRSATAGPGTQIKLEPQKTLFLSLSNESGVPGFIEVSQELALQKLADLRRQLHVISRVRDGKDCGETKVKTKPNIEPLQPVQE